MGKGWAGTCGKEIINTVQLELTEVACEADKSACKKESHELQDYVTKCIQDSGECTSGPDCAFEAVTNSEFTNQMDMWKEYFPYSE